MSMTLAISITPPSPPASASASATAAASAAVAPAAVHAADGPGAHLSHEQVVCATEKLHQFAVHIDLTIRLSFQSMVEARERVGEVTPEKLKEMRIFIGRIMVLTPPLMPSLLEWQRRAIVVYAKAIKGLCTEPRGVTNMSEVALAPARAFREILERSEREYIELEDQVADEFVAKMQALCIEANAKLAGPISKQ